MPSSTSSFESASVESARLEPAGPDPVLFDALAATRPGFVRPTASDRPGVAQPVPERDIPQRPWPRIFAVAMILTLGAIGVWEWRMRALGLEAGDLGDGASAWAEQRRRIDAGNVAVAIVGDSRILFDTDLDRFEQLTGQRPVQLALPGTNARPFLEHLADEPRFTGLAIVGIADTSYFRDAAGLHVDAIERYRFESPSSRGSFLTHRVLSRAFAFLDDNYRLSKLVRQLDEDWRAGTTMSVPERAWKFVVFRDGRQASLWPRIESDLRVREHQRAVWRLNAPGADKPIADEVIARTQAKTRAAVEKIRARGGEVVFLRPPSAPQYRAVEDKRLPRTRGWDALLAAAHVTGVHADEMPVARALSHSRALPEYSHLTRGCATVYTDAYVRALARLTPRLALRADAPPPLRAEDCATAGSAQAIVDRR